MNPDYSKFCGIVTPLATPYLDGKLDQISYMKLLQYQLASGINGVFTGGITSEFPSVSVTDRKKAMDIAAEFKKDGFLVVAGISGKVLSETCNLGKYAESLGLNAVVVAPKYETRVPAHILLQMIADRISLPLIIYDNKGAFGEIVSNLELTKIYRAPGLGEKIAGFKDSSDDASLTEDRLFMRDKYAPWVRSFVGSEKMMLDKPELKGDGVVSGTANGEPKLMVSLWEKGKDVGCFDENSPDVIGLRRIIATYSNGQMIPQIKARLKEKGIFTSDELAPRNLAELVR